MSVRVYGEGEKRLVVVHGGPGAPGYMAPVARELAQDFGVIEPLQSASTLEGQIEELHQQVNGLGGQKPMTFLGSSWGATLVLFYAARYPSSVSDLILSGSCVYDAKSSQKVKDIRFSRMNPETKRELDELMRSFEECAEEQRNEIFAKAADCYFEPDTFEADTTDLEVIECQHGINQSVWADFKIIRDNGDELKEIFSKVKCPVLNIHGDYDPHIIEGIQPFLEQCISNIELVTLAKCGHYPWIEKHAKKLFFECVRKRLEGSY